MRLQGSFIMRWVLLVAISVTGSARAAGLLAPTDQTLPPLRVTDHLVDVSVHDRQTGMTERVSVDTAQWFWCRNGRPV